MPAYNEQPARIMAALEVIHADLGRLDVADDFDLFILSDTTDSDAWIAEEAAYLALRQHTGATNIYYRIHLFELPQQRQLERPMQTLIILAQPVTPGLLNLPPNGTA